MQQIRMTRTISTLLQSSPGLCFYPPVTPAWKRWATSSITNQSLERPSDGISLTNPFHRGIGLTPFWAPPFVIGRRRERGSLKMWASAGRKWRTQDVWSQSLSLFSFLHNVRGLAQVTLPLRADSWSKRHTRAKCLERLGHCHSAAIPITGILVMTCIVLVMYSQIGRANDSSSSGDHTGWIWCIVSSLGCD